MSANPLKELTIEYLQALINQGQTHIDVTEEANDILKQWYLSMKRGNRPAPIREQTIPIAQQEQSNDNADSQPLGESASSALQQAIEEAMMEGEQELKENERPPIPAKFKFDLEGSSKEQRLQSLLQITQNWHHIKDLASLRNKLVFSSGNIHAEIMFVTDAPGLPEELHGQPFSGPAGQKFDAILKAMGVSRHDVYITHLVKYRPALPNQTTNNRPPSDEEIQVFRHILTAEIELISPKVIVTLGAIATKGVLQSGDTPLSELRGKVHQVNEIPLIASFNPSYLLRTEDIGERRKIWEDMLQAMEHAQWDISDKQRNYFLPKSN